MAINSDITPLYNESSWAILRTYEMERWWAGHIRVPRLAFRITTGIWVSAGDRLKCGGGKRSNRKTCRRYRDAQHTAFSTPLWPDADEDSGKVIREDDVVDCAPSDAKTALLSLPVHRFSLDCCLSVAHTHTCTRTQAPYTTEDCCDICVMCADISDTHKHTMRRKRTRTRVDMGLGGTFALCLPGNTLRWSTSTSVGWQGVGAAKFHASTPRIWPNFPTREKNCCWTYVHRIIWIERVE